MCLCDWENDMDYWLQLSITAKNTSAEDAENEAIVVEPNNWLRNNSPMLLDIPNEQLAPSLERHLTIKAQEQQLKFSSDADGFFLQANNGLVGINSGDIIETENFLLQVQINKSQKSRVSDIAVFNAPRSEHIMPRLEHITDYDYTRQRNLNHNPLGILPYATAKPVASHPLAFLGSVTQESTDAWLTPSTPLLVSHDDFDIIENPVNYLQKSFDVPNYIDKNSNVSDKLQFEDNKSNLSDELQFQNNNSNIPDDLQFQIDDYNILDFPSAASTHDVTPMYSDMQENNIKQNYLQSPLDEVDQMLSEQFDKSFNQSAGIHQQVASRLDASIEHMLPNLSDDLTGHASESKFLQKLRKHLWGA
jgi:hypothetical protein